VHLQFAAYWHLTIINRLTADCCTKLQNTPNWLHGNAQDYGSPEMLACGCFHGFLQRSVELYNSASYEMHSCVLHFSASPIK